MTARIRRRTGTAGLAAVTAALIAPMAVGPAAAADGAVAAAGVVVASGRADGAKGNGDSFGPSLSSDGTRVAFGSLSTNLDPRDTDARADVYVKDLSTGALTLVSVDAGGRKLPVASTGAALAPGGGAVAFVTPAPLDARDRNGEADVYVRDLAAATVTLASAQADGTALPLGAEAPALSADGSRVAFLSGGAVRVKDLRSGGLTTVSELAGAPSLSADGTRVAADGRYTGDGGFPSPVVADLTGGTTRTLPRNFYVAPPSVAGDGASVAYTTSDDSSNAGPCSVQLDTGAQRCLPPANGPSGTVAVGSFAGVADLSAGGRRAAINHSLTLEAADGAETGPSYRRVYVQDLVTGAVLWASPRNPGRAADGDSTAASLDAAGGRVSFESTATTLSPGDGDAVSDVYVVDLAPAGGDTRGCTIVGTDRGDVLTATSGRDVICAGAGNDEVHGGGGNDVVYGGPGDDRLYGDAGADVLDGGDGADYLHGGWGDDLLRGGAGRDRCVGGIGTNRLQACEATTG